MRVRPLKQAKCYKLSHAARPAVPTGPTEASRKAWSVPPQFVYCLDEKEKQRIVYMCMLQLIVGHDQSGLGAKTVLASNFWRKKSTTRLMRLS